MLIMSDSKLINRPLHTISLAIFISIVVVLFFTVTPKANARVALEDLGDLLYYEPKEIADKTEFIDEEGEQVNLAKFKGKLVVLNFWATWCVPCVVEMPSLERLQQYFEESELNAVVITVAEDFHGMKVVKKWFKNKGLVYLTPYVDDRNNLFNDFEIVGLPTTIIINQQSQEITRISGDINWDHNEWREFITNLASAVENGEDNNSPEEGKNDTGENSGDTDKKDTKQEEELPPLTEEQQDKIDKVLGAPDSEGDNNLSPKPDSNIKIIN